MNGDPRVNQCRWDERVLGRPRGLRRALTIPVLVLLGGWVAYVKVDHASRPPEEPVASLGAFLSDIAVPEALFNEARKEKWSRVFEDYAAYREFLQRNGLAQSVLIASACSEEGEFLYNAFPPLDDPNTFHVYIACLPMLVSVRAHGTPTDLTQVHPLPAVQLAIRSAAENSIGTESLLRPRVEQRQTPGGPNGLAVEGGVGRGRVSARGR
jgi:hypothetical protein